MANTWTMIGLAKEGPLAIVTLTNPPLNVLHPQMAAELDECFSDLATDPDVVVAILVGQGDRAFCAGFDIKEFPRMMEPGGAEALGNVLHTSLGKIAHLGKPTIAAVNGLALGGGLEVAYDLNDSTVLAVGGAYQASRFRLDDDGFAAGGIGENAGGHHHRRDTGKQTAWLGHTHEGRYRQITVASEGAQR